MTDQIMNDFGKVPPQCISAEEKLIGTCLVYPDVISDIKLTPQMFYKDSHQKIFECILELSGKGVCDIITVTDCLNRKSQLESIGGPLALTKLTQNIFSDQLIENCALLIKEKYLLREYINLGSKLSEIAFIEDLADVVEYAENGIFQLSDFTQIKEPEKISKLIDEYLIEVEKIIKKEKRLSGVASGFTIVDRITGGWQQQDLIIIAGRPSMGKTAVALSIARGAAECGSPAAIFSLEMSRSQLTGRYLSSVSGRTNMELRAGRVDLVELGVLSNQIANLPIFIDDTPAISILELRSKVKKLIVKHGVRLIIIDYLQLMTSSAGSREQEVSQISRGLKGIAKEFNIPVIALSQLNRKVEDRTDRKPRLSDLRESGTIEQDSDIVGFVHRPAHYDMKTVYVNGSEIPSAGIMIFDIAKNRNGACITLPLYHNEALTIIKDEPLELKLDPFNSESTNVKIDSAIDIPY